MRMVRIEWVDANGGPQEWEAKGELTPLEPASCTTVGFLLVDAADYLTVVQSVSGDDLMSRLAIPREVIRRVTYLEDGL